MKKKDMPNQLTFRAFPVEMGSNYRVSAVNAIKLLFSIPLGIIRAVQVSWLMLREHLADSDLVTALLALYGMFIVGPVAVLVLVFDGLLCAAKGRLSSVTFEQSAAK